MESEQSEAVMDTDSNYNLAKDASCVPYIVQAYYYYSNTTTRMYVLVVIQEYSSTTTNSNISAQYLIEYNVRIGLGFIQQTTERNFRVYLC